MEYKAETPDCQARFPEMPGPVTCGIQDGVKTIGKRENGTAYGRESQFQAVCRIYPNQNGLRANRRYNVFIFFE
jgi:hypothetical protein